MTPSEVLKFAEKNGAKFVDLKFVDLPGIWQHTTVSIQQLKEDSFTEGFGMDGSSIRGWQAINASDMLIIPDASTAKMDPFTKFPTLSLICDVQDPITREPYTRDPRNIILKAEKYLKSTGIADTCYFGPEAEFFVFDDVRFDMGPNHSFYHVDSVEGRWNTGRSEEPNLGYKPAYKGGYFPVPPTDSLQDLRSEICTVLQELGFYVEVSHHEVATGGQCEIDLRFSPLVQSADQLMWFKYVVKNVALRNGKTATFMPKPLFGATARRRPSCRSRCSATTARACTAISRCGRTRSRCSPATSTRA
jgi:glutamine synthetase